MVFAVVMFLSVFLLVASLGFLMFYREAMVQRISAVIWDRPRKEGIGGKLRKTGSSMTVVAEKIQSVVPKSKSEVGIVQQRLIRAGFRNDVAMKYFYACKVIVPLAFCAIISFTPLTNESPFIFYAAALGLGYLAPDFWLSRQIKKRQAAIRRGLPDVLDLMVICLEAGLGIDQATARTAQELGDSLPVIADELDIVVLEQRAGKPRSDAWRHMADRTDVDSVRNLVSMLVQSEQFGTSVAKTLRTHADTLRTQRVQTLEEAAAKTTVKLIFPLVLFIFPCLFLVTLGPAFILMADEFKDFLKH
jgi:tight adherence protein C